MAPAEGTVSPAPAPPVGSWPADRVERLAIERLYPYARNARLHTAEQVEQIARNMARVGVTNPVIVDDAGEIIAGHGRILAAQRLGWSEIAGIRLRPDEWTEEEKRAQRIWDNQSALLSTWDGTALRTELTELRGAGYDLDLVGFPQVELVEFMTGLGDGRERTIGNLADRFGVPPWTVLNAREGWWQDRKRAWIALGIQSELGRGASPGGSPRPAADYGERERGDGAGRPIEGGADFSRSGAVMPVAAGDVKQELLKRRGYVKK